MHWRCLLAGALSAALAHSAAAPVWAPDATPAAAAQLSTADSTPAPVILQLRVIAGDGLVHTAGSRSPEVVTVLVTDETGRPIPRAAVSVRLPDDGPTGQFRRGLKSEVLLTGPDGRARFGDVAWGVETGPLSLRITAAKGTVRAGGVCSQYITDAKVVSVSPPPAEPKPGSDKPNGWFHMSNRMKWTLISLAASGVAGTVAARRKTPAAPAPTNIPQPTPIPSSGPPPQLGTPTITVGHP